MNRFHLQYQPRRRPRELQLLDRPKPDEWLPILEDVPAEKALAQFHHLSREAGYFYRVVPAAS